MARYLLGTTAFVSVVARNPSDPVKRWVDALRYHDDELLLSVVSLGELQRSITELPPSRPSRASWQGNFDDIVRHFVARGSLLDFTSDCARRWADLEPLQLIWRDPASGEARALPSVRRQVVAQSLAGDLTLVELAQPYHDVLTPHGLRVADLEAAPLHG